MERSIASSGLFFQTGAGFPSLTPEILRGWAGEKPVASQLTEDQLRKAFEAAGATPEEIDGYSKKIVEKIGQLQAAVR